MKYCNKCSTLKEFSSFNKRSDTDQLRAHCKACCSKDNKHRYETKRGPKKPRYTAEQKRIAQLETYRRHNKKRRAYQAACEARRRAAKLRATPKWLTDSQKYHIDLHYGMAALLTKTLNTQMDVDHIIPLKGKEVSGLHVPWNLQILEHSANIQKNNKVEL